MTDTDASPKLTTDASLKLTTDVDDFIDSLKSGDILLFDSMHGISHLIKLAENRPVNHAALYTADGQFLHVILSNPPSKAVHTGSLKETLDLREVLTVTALRHADGETLWPKVQKAAQDIEKESRYALLGLICLFVPTLLRSYAKQALKRPRDGLLLEFRALANGGSECPHP